MFLPTNKAKKGLLLEPEKLLRDYIDFDTKVICFFFGFFFLIHFDLNANCNLVTSAVNLEISKKGRSNPDNQNRRLRRTELREIDHVLF